MHDRAHTRAPQHTLQSTAKETLMTNDNFNDAARAEAERVARENTPLEYGSIWDAFVDAYAAGLQARIHLAAQEPTTAEVEAFQDCLYERTLTWVPGVEVRAAMSAARAARREKEER